MKGHFVGFDEELKDYRIYWPDKKKVSIEWDVYFNKDEVLQPTKTQIEGEWDVPVKLDLPKTSSNFQSPPKTNKNIKNTPITLNKNTPPTPPTTESKNENPQESMPPETPTLPPHQQT